MSELTIRDFRANLKAFLDRVEAGEVFTLRNGHVHIAADESCVEHIDEDLPSPLAPQA